MRKSLLAAAFATATLLPISEAAMASEVQITSTGPVLDLSVTDSAEGKPDQANFSTGVETLAPTATEAVRQNAEKMNAVIARVKKLGVADKDIQTSQLNLSQSYDYVDGKQVSKGFQASNMVNVKLRDLTKLGSFLDALASDGATNFNGPIFGVEDNTALTATARQKAWSKLTAQANTYAKLAGYSGVKVLKIAENPGYGVQPVMYKMAMNDAVPASTPIEPGQVSQSITISASFELVK